MANKNKSEDREHSYTLEELVEDLNVDELTDRKRALLTEKIKDVLAKPSERRTKQELLEAAGFSPMYYDAFDDIKEYTDPVVKLLAQEQLRAIQSLKDKIDESNYRDVILAVDKLTKNIQLLMEEATERVEQETTLTEEQYDRLFKLEAKRKGWRPPEEGDIVEEDGEAADGE